MRRFLLVALVATVFGDVAIAQQQNLATRPNATVKISASSTEVTRISISGDRIRRIIKDASNFDEMNDETTGDVFLRYAGPQDKLEPETGYIITEKGATLGYELTPKVGLGAETVLITVRGMPETASVSGRNETASVSSYSLGFELAAGEGGGGYSSSLVAFTRSAINKHVNGKRPPARSHGTTVATENTSGLRARVIVAAAGKGGRYVRPQDFYNGKVLAVWVEKNALTANERAWVIVLEKR